MKVAFRSSFIRDLKKIKDRYILEQVKQAIEDIECAQDLRTVSNIKKQSKGTDRIKNRWFRFWQIILVTITLRLDLLDNHHKDFS